MPAELQRLKTHLAVAIDLSMAEAVLHWDQTTYMPSAGSEARAQQIATLSRLAHQTMTADIVGELLQTLEPWAAQQEADNTDAALIRKVRREFDRQQKLPGDFVARYAKTCALANQVWERARAASDFARFRPWLEQIFDMTGEMAGYLGYTDHIYDPLLDDYEPGMKSAQVEAIFTPLRQETVKLVQALAAERQVDDSILHGPFAHDSQMALGNRLIQAFGFDFRRGRVDLTAHPYCIHFSHNDVRITTRVDPDNLAVCLFGFLHECGHALYEQGSGAELEGTHLAGGTSLGIHESQSRMWENLVARSPEFWQWATPVVQEFFPQLQGAHWQQLYQAINKVAPTLIRIDADEVTYNLHIMLRFELEKAILEGRVRVQDLPQEWNARMESYLGIVPPDDAHGVLQDVHWSEGLIGYFPTYTLGNLISVQLYAAACREHPTLPQEFQVGKFDTLLAWLRRHIHHHGAKYPPLELLQRAAGEGLNAQPYIHYLQQKVQSVYGTTG